MVARARQFRLLEVMRYRTLSGHTPSSVSFFGVGNKAKTVLLGLDRGAIGTSGELFMGVRDCKHLYSVFDSWKGCIHSCCAGAVGKAYEHP